ncbi:ankyrin repeat domain-containing protein [Brachyspira sp.]|uniref:ankyrin repeat domain-containing protein n=1 Tax=Brachyspira sp. TaxID=1977261 RepID=UPI00260C8620|nr:ankyrin repeat domain-containing protein [Brachyspira sp.]
MKKIIIIALIFISIISCNSKKTNNIELTTNEIDTNTLETNQNIETNIIEYNIDGEEEYEGYAANENIDDILKMAGEENLKILEELNTIKNANSLDTWQLKYKHISPIIFAASYYPTEEKAIKLIEYGASINKTDFNGITPLMKASSMGYIKLVKELIKNNANVNARAFDLSGNISGDALFYAVTSNNKNSLGVIKLLLNFGANPNVIYLDTEKGNFTILDKSLHYNNFEIFKTLVENGADIGRVDEKGEPLIADAIRLERFDIVKYLVYKGIDPTMKYTDYRNVPFSLLVATVTNQNTKIAEYLIENGADVNSKDVIDSSSEEPVNLIFTAIENGNTQLVKLLIENNADTTAVNIDGNTIFDVARKKGYNEIIKLENK